MTNPIPSKDGGDRWVSIHQSVGVRDPNLFFVYLPSSNGMGRDIAVSRRDLVEGLKRAGLTADDFRERTAVEQIEEMPIGTHFTYTIYNSQEYVKVSQTQVAHVTKGGRSTIIPFDTGFKNNHGSLKIKED